MSTTTTVRPFAVSADGNSSIRRGQGYMPKEVEKFVAAIEAFRQLDPEMPAQTIMTFLTVAHNPGITLTRLAEHLGLALSSTSRNVYSLSRLKVGTTPGHDLLAYDTNPMNRREKIVNLTPKGERFYSQLQRLLK